MSPGGDEMSFGGGEKNFGALRALFSPLTQISTPLRSFLRSTPGNVNWHLLNMNNPHNNNIKENIRKKAF